MAINFPNQKYKTLNSFTPMFIIISLEIWALNIQRVLQMEYKTQRMHP